MVAFTQSSVRRFINLASEYVPFDLLLISVSHIATGGRRYRHKHIDISHRQTAPARNTPPGDALFTRQ